MSENNNSIERAEQRVREMNTVTRRYAEQGSRYMQNMNADRSRTRFETVDVRPEEISAPQPRQAVQAAQAMRNTQNMQRGNVPQNLPQNVNKTVKSTEKSGENVHKDQQQHVHKSVSPNVPSGGDIDGERLLLLAVIYLLMRENADIKLILALCYLIL